MTKQELIKGLLKEAVEKPKYVIVQRANYAYAQGSGGTNLYVFVFAGPDKLGFNSTREAKKAWTDGKNHNEYKFKTKKRDGLGWGFPAPEVMTIDEFEKAQKSGDYTMTHGTYSYWHNGKSLSGRY